MLVHVQCLRFDFSFVQFHRCKFQHCSRARSVPALEHTCQLLGCVCAHLGHKAPVHKPPIKFSAVCDCAHPLKASEHGSVTEIELSSLYGGSAARSAMGIRVRAHARARSVLALKLLLLFSSTVASSSIVGVHVQCLRLSTHVNLLGACACTSGIERPCTSLPSSSVLSVIARIRSRPPSMAA